VALSKNSTAQGNPNPLGQVVGMFANYVDAKPHYLVGMALWALHTHTYSQYRKSPRLAMLSPVPNCGKSTVLDVLSAMVWNPKRLIDPTAATTFRLANKHTLLIDEVDNMSIVKNMRAVLNEGHQAGGSVTRTGSEGEVIEYPVYGPVALAGIGRLPASLMSRSLVIKLYRSTKQLPSLGDVLPLWNEQFSMWAEQASLDSDPQMPQIMGREADKWRPLIAMNQGDLGRNVALEFLKESNASDIRVNTS
jgi:hypothetical protein